MLTGFDFWVGILSTTSAKFSAKFGDPDAHICSPAGPALSRRPPPKTRVDNQGRTSSCRRPAGRQQSNMDGHPQKQSSEDAPLPDDLFDAGASSAADALSTDRTAARRGRGRPPKGKGKGKEKSTKKDLRRSRRRSGSLGGRSAECSSTAGRSGGGGSIRDSAHDPTRGRGVQTGATYSKPRGSARGDEEDGPPRRRRKIQRKYQDGSTYVGEALGEKLDGLGKFTFPSGEEMDGIFVDGKFDRGMATNLKLKCGGRYTGQIVGGKLDKGMAMNMKLPCGGRYTGQMV